MDGTWHFLQDFAVSPQTLRLNCFQSRICPRFLFRVPRYSRLQTFFLQ